MVAVERSKRFCERLSMGDGNLIGGGSQWDDANNDVVEQRWSETP